MKRVPNIFNPGLFFLLGTIVIAIVLGWHMGRGGGSPVPVRAVQLKGPMDSTICGPLAQPLPPPAFDNPYGLHLYATNPIAIVRPLPAIMIVDQLGLPQAADNPASATTPPASGEAKNETGLDDVQSVGMILEEFRRAFGTMPVGELNDEIVRRLQGENPKGIAVLPKTHPAINGDGELIDRWGTPYRFHPESFWQTTVRSAGPDKRMWTADDILTDSIEGGDLAAKL